METGLAVGGDTVAPARKFRGKTKAGKNWKREGDVSVIALELDLSGDPAMRGRLEKQWSAAFQLERAIKSDARDRTRAFDEWKSGWWYQRLPKSRRGPACRARQAELGLSQDALEKAAAAHIEKSKHLRDHVTKAQALHHASAVWATTSRHLYPDKNGDYFGAPKVGSWWDFTRMVGRARSHTKPRVWETFRLMGTLQGHLNRFATAPVQGLTVPQVRELAPSLLGQSLFDQPGAMPAPETPTNKQGGWWLYQGPLVVVFTGLPGGDMRLPVRLPSGAGDFDHLAHFLADPTVWHKLDLVRVRDRRAPGGWRHHAHLTVLKSGYQAPSTKLRRQTTPWTRVAGIDANVSNLAVASQPRSLSTNADSYSLAVTIVAPTQAEERQAVDSARQIAHASAHLDRSRRASNPDQYSPSKAQEKRAKRRDAKGLEPRKIDVPKGKRDSNSRGVPNRAYRNDQLTRGYRKTRADKAALQASGAQRKTAVAKRVAADLVAEHGNQWLTEDVSMATWQQTWGKRMAVTTPGRVMAALAHEIEATNGTLTKFGTAKTWLSQRCVCGHREKKPLSQRWHSCPECALEADRDVLSAALATTITVPNPDKPGSGSVDETKLGVLKRRISAQQEGRVRSTITLGIPGGDGSRQYGTAAGRDNSTGQPRNRQPRKGTPRRRRKIRATDGTPRADL